MLSKFITQILVSRLTFGLNFVEFWECSKFKSFARFYKSKFVFILYKLVVVIMFSKFATQILGSRPTFGSSIVEFWECSKFSCFARFYKSNVCFPFIHTCSYCTLSKFTSQILEPWPTFASSFVEFWERWKFSCFAWFYKSKFVFLLDKLIVIIMLNKFTTQIYGSRPTFGSSFIEFW